VSAYKHALAISSDAAPERVELARSLLEQGAQVVLLDDQVAVRATRDGLLCEVIDPYSDGPCIKSRFEGLLASAHALVQESPLYGYLCTRKLHWVVVTDYGTGTQQLWPHS